MTPSTRPEFTVPLVHCGSMIGNGMKKPHRRPWQGRFVVAACAVAVGCVGELSGVMPPSGATLSVADVNRQRDALVGQRIDVIGRVHANQQMPDPTADGPGSAAPETAKATLHLVNPEQSSGALKVLNLYRRDERGQFKPLSCVVRAGIFECGKYAPGAVVTIGGTWVREQLPAGQVVHPGGRIEIIAWRTAYFLVVA